jgi:hypothetical protein
MPVKRYNGTDWVVVAGDGAAGAPGTNGTNGIDASPFAAGKNKIINGDFNVNQRNFSSSTVGNGNLLCFDRWMQFSLGGTTTWSAQIFTPGAAPVSGYEGRNFLQIVSTGQSGSGDNSRITQKIESVRTFAGQTVSVSFWARSTSGTPSLASYAYQDFGTGGSASAGLVVNGNKVTLSTSWARYSISIAIPSISGKTIGTNNDDCLWIQFVTSGGSDFNTPTNSIGIQSTTIQLWGVQIEAGSVATAFQTATGTIQGELAACQRYYYKTSYSSGGLPIGIGTRVTSTEIKCVLYAPVFMRIPATLTTSAFGTFSTSFGVMSITGINGASAYTGQIGQISFAVGSGTTATSAFVEGANSSCAIEWSAEL